MTHDSESEEMMTLWDEIDALAQGERSREVADAIGLAIDEICVHPGGLDALLDRYAQNEHPYIQRSLAFYLSRASHERPQGEERNKIHRIIPALVASGDREGHWSALSAVETLSIWAVPWYPPEAEPPATIAMLLLSTLKSSALFVDDAVSLLSRLAIEGLLQRFPVEQRERLSEALEARMNGPDGDNVLMPERVVAARNGLAGRHVERPT